MSSIDDRIVEMKFDNAQFEAGVRQTLGSLSALNQGLKLDGVGKGIGSASRSMGELADASKRVSFSSMAEGASNVGKQFGAMSVVAITALATVTSKAVASGITIAKALSLKPAIDGWKDYELKIGATQTIMAGTGESIGSVTKYLKELDTYADQTIYSLSDMVNNIGKFTNAGVKLPVAVNAMKGISNVAAVSGASAGEAARAMYNLGQAIGQGTVKLMDWRSVELANMGTKEFKEQLIQSAVAMGTLKKSSDGTLKTTKGNTVSFKNFSTTLQDGWLTAEALTSTLSRYADETTAIGKKSYAAAKDVKTFSMMVDTLKAAAGTGWTDTFDLVIGNLPQAKKMWTDLSNTLGGLMNTSANARNKLLKDWSDLGGRMVMIVGIKKTFQALVAVIQPIKDAFRNIFPATTGKQLYDMMVAFRDFMDGLKIGHETALKLQRIFQGLFAVLDIGWMLIKGGVGVLRDLFGAATEGSGGFLDFAVKIGDWLNNVRYALKYGGRLNTFFDGLGKVLSAPIRFIKNLAAAFGVLFDGFNTDAIPAISAKFAPLGALGKVIAAVWTGVSGQLKKVWDTFFNLPSQLGEIFSGVGKAVGSAVSDISFDNLVTMINTGLIATLLMSIRGFIKTLTSTAEEASGLLKAITSPFKELSGTLEQMQKTLKAATLLQIAIAVGVLTLSVVALSKVDEKGLKRALKAMTVMFIELTAAMAIFQKIQIRSGMIQLLLLAGAIRVLASAVKILGGMNFVDLMQGLNGVAIALGLMVLAARAMPDGKKMISSSIGLIAMATAVKILASAVTDLAGLSWEEMARGLTGVGTLLGALTLFTKFAEANKGGIAQGVGLILLATGVKILASAMKDFAQFSWDEIGRGLTVMGGGLALMSAALLLIPPTSVFSAAAVLAVAASLGMIADALGKMGGMKWEEIGKGLLVLGSALGMIGLALSLMPPTSVLSAAAIFIVATSLGLLATALGKMGAMGWEAIAKGLVVLAGALTIIAVAVTAMALALPGAVALTIIVAALGLFLPIIMLLGNMSWEEIAKGLTMLAGTFLVLGVAGALLTPVIPTLLGLGLAITLLGVGMAAAGLGLLAFATGLSALAISGAAGAAAIVGIVASLVGTIPMVMEQIGLGIVAFAKVIATSGPAMTAAMTAVMISILDSVGRVAPKVVSTLLRMLTMLLIALSSYVPMMVSAGLRLVTGILTGVAANLRGVITAAVSVIVAFLDGIGKNLPRIIDSGVKLIISFVNGVANAIRDNSAEMGAAGVNLAEAIVEGMVKGIGGGLGEITGAAKRLAHSALDAAKAALGIKSPSREFAKLGKYSAEGFAKGLDGNKSQIYAAYGTMKTLLSDAMKAAKTDIAQAQSKLSKLTHARNKDAKAIRAATLALAQSRAEYKRASTAYSLSRTWGDETAKLGKLATQQDLVAKKLDAANKKLADAVKTRDDYNKSIKDQYSNLPDISKETNLNSYVGDLQKQVIDTQLFTAQLQQLRKLGLNDAMYKELLAKGPDAMPFAQQLLEGGKTSVNEINTLGTALSKAASALGNSASSALYQAAVDSAAGLVKGLQNQQKAIEAQMDKIAASMVNAIKKALGIRSPSREFMKVGDWSAKGLAQGLRDSAAPVQAAEDVGQNAIEAMRKTLTGLNDAMVKDIDSNPTIKPVLDLTDVKKGAGQIGRMLPGSSLKMAALYSHARDASNGYKTNRDAYAAASATSTESGGDVVFNQTINAPKAPSPADVYRQTKNQISTAKGVLRK